MVADVGVSRYPNGGERLQRLGQPERLRRCERFEDSITKHGEVSFPTQVRYDVVFIIGPFIIIKALIKKGAGIVPAWKKPIKNMGIIFCLTVTRAAPRRKCYRSALGCYKIAFSPMGLSPLP